jgi:catechol 2,3-dioxygenase-like lactoylglutathione lyase family enzyme
MIGKLGWPTWIGVVAEDLNAQRRFYRDTLGLTETGAGDGWVHFELEGGLFEIVQRTSDVQYSAPRYQVGFTVADIELTAAELREAGVRQLTEIEGGAESPNRWCYFQDNEGNVFEITQWVMGQKNPTR